MARRADHTRPELKGLIIQAAIAIVEKEGSEDLTARRIAHEIGYTPGTLYNVFESMEDVILNINASTLDQLYEALRIEGYNNPSRHIVGNLNAMATAYITFAQKNRNRWLLLFSSRLPDARIFEGWYHEKIDRLFEPLEELLAPMFVHNGSEIKIAARALFSSVHGICFLQETGRLPLVNQSLPEASLVEYLIEKFVTGVMLVR